MFLITFCDYKFSSMHNDLKNLKSTTSKKRLCLTMQFCIGSRNMKYAIESNKEESYACVSGWRFPLWSGSFLWLPGFTFTDPKQEK